MNQTPNSLRERASALHLHGILAHWSEISSADWLPGLIQWEEQARAQRSLERRIGGAHIGPLQGAHRFQLDLAQAPGPRCH